MVRWFSQDTRQDLNSLSLQPPIYILILFLLWSTVVQEYLVGNDNGAETGIERILNSTGLLTTHFVVQLSACTVLWLCFNEAEFYLYLRMQYTIPFISKYMISLYVRNSPLSFLLLRSFTDIFVSFRLRMALVGACIRNNWLTMCCDRFSFYF